MLPSSARRRFLRDVGCLSLGAISMAWFRLPSRPGGAAVAAEGERPPAEERVRELKLDIPQPGPSNPMLASAVRSGNLLFVSGHIPRNADGKPIVGKVGRDMDTKAAAEAARGIALQILGVVRKELGSLDKVSRLVKVLGMVNCTPDFTETPQVINGFSQVLIDVYGEVAGRGARSAVGMGSLPLGVPVEVEAIFEIGGSPS